MGNLRSTFIAVIAAAGLALASSAQAAEQSYGDVSNGAPPSAAAMAFDFVVVRPLGLVATVAGVGLFVVSLPLAIFTWDVKDPAQRLIVDPAQFTFTRELGNMD